MYKFYAKHVSDTVISKPLNITGGGIGRFDFCYYLLKYAPTVDWSKNNNNKIKTGLKTTIITNLAEAEPLRTITTARYPH